MSALELSTSEIYIKGYPFYGSKFKYSTSLERFLVAAAIALASLASICVTYCLVIYGEFTSLLIDRSVGIGSSSPTIFLQAFGGGTKLTNATREQNLQAIRDDALAFGIGSLIGALLEWLLLAVALDLFNHVALKQVNIFSF
ncbi:multidrug resistance protein homolog 49-like [Teleopsis dalmanni]|uniref:multidrug resistance protein homolog 49-like n=1 Tax=Teleopsis dalmanni TaxID=139649 RepID=UPI0018CFEDB0|nr:multidrug resistance protein homolog 49-like [Teleopsis dalmanni]